MDKLELKFRDKWLEAVEFFARLFGLKTETANTTLLVAIVPAMIAISQGLTYLWQCLSYSLVFNVPISLIQTTDSIWVSFLKGVLYVMIVAGGTLWSMFWLNIIDKRDLKWKIKGAVAYFFPLLLEGYFIFFNDRLLSKLTPFMLLFSVGACIGLHLFDKRWNSKDLVSMLCLSIVSLLVIFFLLNLQKPYPITTTEAGKNAAIVYLTTETAVLEEVEFQQDENNQNILIIHKNKQEIPSSTSSLTYEYQTFDNVKIEP